MSHGFTEAAHLERDHVVGQDLDHGERLDPILSGGAKDLHDAAHLRHAGRQQGRPEKTFQKGNVFLAPRDVRSTAGKRAGFSSPSLALRAEASVTRGSTELQTNVLDGALAISAGCGALPKRAKNKATTPTPTSSGTNDTGAGGAPGDPKHDDLPESSPLPEIAPPNLASSAPPPIENVRRDRGDTDDAAREGPTSPSSEPEPEEEPDQPPADDEELADPPFTMVDDEEGEPTDVAPHVSALCAHIGRLAEHDYDEAVRWFDDLVEQMRGALGERPESDESEDETERLDVVEALQDL